MLALVTSALSNEILLSWRTLQRLGVISEEFPRFDPGQVHVKTAGTIDSAASNEAEMLMPESEDKKHEQDELPAGTDMVNHLNEAVAALKEEYQSVFEAGEKLDEMAGGSMKIKLKDNITIKPLHLNTPRKTPYAYQGSAKAKLDHMVELGVLEKVEEVSEWCNPMSFVPKPDGDVRPVIDLVHLNKYVERPVIRFRHQRIL